MADPALQDAGRRLRYAMSCHANENYQEAYKHYLATTSSISNELLKRSSNEVWCDVKTEKLLDLAQKCIDAAKLINSLQNEKDSARLEQSVVNPDINSTPSVTAASPEQSNVAPVTSEAPTPEAEGGDPTDMLSILDSLPDVPANKPGEKYQRPVKRSATLQPVRKTSNDDLSAPKRNAAPGLSESGKRKTLPPNYFNQHLPANFSSYTLPRNTSTFNSPHSANHQSAYFSAPVGANLGGTMSSPVVLKVSPMEQAQQKNAALAAHYERRAQQGRVNPRWRLDLARAQEENMNIARELEKTLAKKSELRKQRLEQERLELEEQGDESTERTVGAYEAILYAKEVHVKKFMMSVKEYDTQHRMGNGADVGGQASISKMESVFASCFDDSSHPISTALGDAQYNFYNRIVPLNKKIYMANTKEAKEALHDGVESEVEAITSDISDFVDNLTKVLYNLYPVFRAEDGSVSKVLKTKLSELFYKPFLAQLMETYNFVHEDDLSVFREYITQHGRDDIASFPDIKRKYHLGEAPYQAAIQSLLAITETCSPVAKFKLLVSFAETITHCVRDFYLQSGATEEEANDMAGLGADDLMPISIYVVTRAANPQLVSEIQFLYDVSQDDDLHGQEGYCLATVQSTFSNIISRKRSELTAFSGP